MANKKNETLFRKLTRLFRSGPIVKRKIRAMDTTVAVPDKTKSSGTLLFQKSLAPTYATITANAYNLSERLMRYQDFQEMELCLAGDTLIAVPDGFKRLDELAAECVADPEKKFVVYAYDHNIQQIVPALGKQARQTRVDHAWRVTFDNGKQITGTHDHRLMLRDGTYARIDQLKVGDSMMPFYRKDLFEKAEKGTKGYSWIYTMDSRFRGWTKEHQLIAEWTAGRKLTDDEVVHHINFNKKDNRPENLLIMLKSDHSSLHSTIINKRKWSPENAEWIEKFKARHSAYMKANNPVERKDITFGRILETCERVGFNTTNLMQALDCDGGVIKRRLVAHGFANFQTFAKAYDASWRNGGWDNKGDKNPRYDDSLTFESVCSAFEPNMSAKRLAFKLGTTDTKVVNRIKAAGYENWTSFASTYQNHKVVSVEYVGVMPLYDLTVDGYKNFATDTVVSHNTPEIAAALDIYADESCAQDDKGRVLHVYSDNEKIKEVLEELFYSTLNVEFNMRSWVRNLPIHKDTPIPLLDGTTLTIEALAQRMKDEPTWVPWVYSMQDKTLKMVPGKVVWCDLTRKDSEILRVWLDDGSYVDTAPDHEYVLRDGSAKRADELMNGESLMPFYRKISSKFDGDRIHGYEQAYDPALNAYEYTHKLVKNDPTAPVLRDEIQQVIHHVDLNKRNNVPTNLRAMSWGDHHHLHATLGRELLYTPEAIAKKNASLALFNKTLKFKENQQKKSLLMKNYWTKKSNLDAATKKLTIKFDEKCLAFVTLTLQNAGIYVGADRLVSLLKQDEAFMHHFKTINLHSKRDVCKNLNRTSLKSHIEKLTGKSYPKFVIDLFPQYASQREARISLKSSVTQRQQHAHNHKVERVERLMLTSDVYCMEVHGPEGQHDRHNFMVLGRDDKGDITLNSGTCLTNCKYGDMFLYNDVSPEHGVVNAFPIPVNEIEREENFDRNDPFAVRFRWVSLGNRVLENWEVSHFRLLGNDMFLPYGSSIIEPARRIWRQLILIEDAMLVYRVVRAPERRVFYIDVANIAPNDVPAYVEEQKKNLRSSQVVDNQTGRVDLRYNPLSVDEDYFIPVRGNDTGTKIDTLAGGQNAAAVEDVAYIQKKLFAALKIPRAYLGYDDMLSCLVSNTCVPLLDGGVMTIGKLSEKFSTGQGCDDVWTYSCDPATGEMKPGRIVNAWKTKDVDQVHKITLDNGHVIECTENHPFLCRNGEYVRADQLVVGQSLMAQYCRSSVSKKNGGDDLIDGYEMLLSNKTNEWEYTHKIVDSELCKKTIKKARVVHHVNCNKRDNTPNNLQEMTWSQHRKWHANNLQSTLLRPDVIEKRKKAVLKWLKSDKHREMSSIQMKNQINDPNSGLYKWIHGDEISATVSQLMKKNWEREEYRNVKTKQSADIWNNDVYRQKYLGSNHWSRRKNESCDLEWLKQFCKDNDVTSIKQWRNDHVRSITSKSPVGIRYVNELLNRNGYKTWRDFANVELNLNVPKRGPDRGVKSSFTIQDLAKFCIDNNVTLIGQWTKSHRNSVVGISPVSGAVVHKLLKKHGFKSFNEFKSTLNYNHKVVSIEIVKLDTCVPVYDLEVEKYHNFLVVPQQWCHDSDYSGVYVHNSKATLAQEDIRFSRTINVIQKVLIAELNKLATIHLYANGFTDEDLVNYTLRLSNPSTVAQQQKLEIWRAKFEIAGSMPENMGSQRFAYKQIWGLTDEEIDEINRDKIRDAIIASKLEALGAGEEGAGGGAGGGGGVDLLGGGGDAGGGDLGGDLGGDDGASDAPEEPPEENAGEEPEEEISDVELLTSSDTPSDEVFSIPSSSDNGSPIKVSGQLGKALYNRARRRTHGASKTHTPDFVKMTGNGGNSMNDPFDSSWLDSIVTNPMAESFKPKLTPDVLSTLRGFSLKHRVPVEQYPKILSEDADAIDAEFIDIDLDDEEIGDQ